MKNTFEKLNELPALAAQLNGSEMKYVYTCWTQAHQDAYPNFVDYLKTALLDKKLKGTVYC